MLSENGQYYLKDDPHKTKEVAVSFLASVVEVLVKKSLEATHRYHLNRLIVVGGANSHLRQQLGTSGEKRGIDVLFPPIEYYTDNAAAGAFHHLQVGESHPLSLASEPSLSL